MCILTGVFGDEIAEMGWVVGEVYIDRWGCLDNCVCIDRCVYLQVYLELRLLRWAGWWVRCILRGGGVLTIVYVLTGVYTYRCIWR